LLWKENIEEREGKHCCKHSLQTASFQSELTLFASGGAVIVLAIGGSVTARIVDSAATAILAGLILIRETLIVAVLRGGITVRINVDIAAGTLPSFGLFGIGGTLTR
jgi:hypothetical protein